MRSYIDPSDREIVIGMTRARIEANLVPARAERAHFSSFGSTGGGGKLSPPGVLGDESAGAAGGTALMVRISASNRARPAACARARSSFN